MADARMVRGPVEITNLTEKLRERVAMMLLRLAAQPDYHKEITFEVLPSMVPGAQGQPMPIVSFLLIVKGVQISSNISVVTKPVTNPTAITDELLERLLIEALRSLAKVRDQQLGMGNGLRAVPDEPKGGPPFNGRLELPRG